MKLMRLPLWRTACFVSVLCGLFCGSLAVEAEGLNATYARMANELAPRVRRAVGRDFAGPVYIEGVTPAKMVSVLANDIRLARAERAMVLEADALAESLGQVMPMHYSFSDRRIYFVAQTMSNLFDSVSLSPAGRETAVRMLLAYQLARALLDQSFRMQALLAGAGSEEKSRCIRAITAGEARIVVELVAWDLPHLLPASTVSAWALGQAASRNQVGDLVDRLDEEFEICHAGGYTMASYLYDQFGVEGLHKAFFSPPPSVSLLYNPRDYALSLRDVALPSGASTATRGSALAPVTPADGNEGDSRLRTALLETKQHLPGSSWFEKAFTIDDVITEAAGKDPDAAQEIRDVFAEWEGLALIGVDAKASVAIFGFRLHQEVTEDQVQELLIDLEKSIVGYGKGELNYAAETNIPLAGVGFGSGWVQPGSLSAPGAQAVPTWLLVARTGSYGIYMFAINLPMDLPAVNGMVTAVLGKLQ